MQHTVRFHPEVPLIVDHSQYFPPSSQDFQASLPYVLELLDLPYVRQLR